MPTWPWSRNQRDDVRSKHPQDVQEHAYDPEQEFYELLPWGWLLRPEPSPLVIRSWPPEYEPLHPGPYTVLLIAVVDDASDEIRNFVSELPRGLPRIPCAEASGIPIAHGIDNESASRLTRALEERGALVSIISSEAVKPDIRLEFVQPPPDHSIVTEWLREGIAELYAGPCTVLLLGILTEHVNQEIRELAQQLCKSDGITVADKVHGASAYTLKSVLEEHGALVRIVEPEPIPIPTPATETGPPRRETIPVRVRREVWQRDDGRCVDCGSQERLEYDHIIPWSKGGSNTARNLELRCESCNRRKGARI